MAEADLERAQSIAIESYHLPPGMPTVKDSSFFDDRYVVSDGQTVQGRLLALRFGQFFGGRRVSSSGIAGVAIAPEARGRGFGSAIVKEVIRTLADDGVSMATLYFSNAIPYRKAGFELAGTRIRYSAPVTSCPAYRGEVALRTWTDEDLDAIKKLHSEFAVQSQGLMDRSEFFWNTFLEPPDDDVLHRYCVERDGAITGYMIFSEHTERGHLAYAFAEGDDNLSYAFATRDLVWSDLDSALALMGFAEGHRAWATSLLWTGPVEDPLATVFADRPGKIHSSNHWMARILDVTAALQQRGYPAMARCVFELDISDPVIERNNAAFRVTVEGGRATVEPVSAARSRADIGILSGMFTGWLAPRDAVRLGRLEADDATVLALQTAFAGPKPWLLEIF
jgi:predicted acetyltransferase